MDWIIMNPYLTIALVILFLIIVGIFIYGVYKGYIFNDYNKVCYYKHCNNKVGKVGKYYYKGPNGRVKCAMHPSKNYKKVCKNSKYFRLETIKLPQEEKQHLKEKGKLVYELNNLGFAKILKEINFHTKSIDTKLEINGDQLMIKNSNCGIYLITNKITGIKYVGQSININARFTQHKNQYGTDAFHNELYLKPSNFSHEILIICPRKYLDFFEAYYIKKFNTYQNGYNLTKGNYSHLNQEEIRLLEEIN